MADIEKRTPATDGNTVDSEKFATSEDYQPAPSRGFFLDFVDSFKAPDHYGFDTTGMGKDQIAMTLISRSKPKLTKRHLKMISAAGCVGTGLFIGTGNNLMHGGPGAVIIAAFVIGVAVWITMAAMGELGVRYPIKSSFTMLPARFMDKSWAFALSWNYALCWMIVFPLEIIAAATTTRYWRTDPNPAAQVNSVAWVSLYYVLICAINLIGSTGYAEAEFVFGSIKVTSMIGFIIFAVVINCGGGPNHEYIGGRYFLDPGSFSHGFKGVAAVLVSTAFAFGGTEVAGVSAAEVANPSRALPSAVKEVMWRIIIFFLVGLTMVSLLVAYNDPNLGTHNGNSTSPFVLAIERAGVHGLPSVVNAVIMISTFSVGSASVFASSRTFVALATQGQAPKFMCYIDRRGRPIGAMIPVLIFGLLCFVCASDAYNDVFDWLYAFTSLSFLYAWGSICYCHIRHRHGLKREGIPLSSLYYKSPFGEIGSWIGLGICIFTFAMQMWVAIFPLGGKPNPIDFFQSELSVPTVVLLFFGHKWYSNWEGPITPSKLDVTSEIRVIDDEQYQAEEQAYRERLAKNPALRVYHFFC